MRGREENILRKERTVSQREVTIIPSLALWDNNPQVFPRAPPPAPSLQGSEKACPAEDSYGTYLSTASPALLLQNLTVH